MCEIKDIVLTIFPNSELCNVKQSKTNTINYTFSILIGRYKMFIVLAFSNDSDIIKGSVSLRINFTCFPSRKFFARYPRFKNTNFFEGGISLLSILIEYSAYFSKFLNCEVCRELQDIDEFKNTMVQLTI